MASTKGLDVNASVKVTKSGAKYNPSDKTAQGNGATWSTIKSALAKPQTVKQLQAVCKEQHNHAPFVGYCIRRGWLEIR